jgi:Leucine-rich repeat (LRR) protein
VPQVLLFPHLRLLDVSHCAITSLPEEIGTLRALTFLNASFNEIGALPDSITQLTGLCTLYCMSNRLRALPHDMTAMASLENVDFRRNPDLFLCGARRPRPEQVPLFLAHALGHSRKRRACVAVLQMLCIRRFRRSELLNGFPRELVALVGRALVIGAENDAAWDY